MKIVTPLSPLFCPLENRNPPIPLEKIGVNEGMYHDNNRLKM
jgi:hypothetical protein